MNYAPLILSCVLLLSACQSNDVFPEDAPAERRRGGELAAEIARELGVPQLTLEIEGDEVERQEALGGQVDFETAFRSALESFLLDGENPESPISLFRNGEGLSEEEARVRTQAAMNQASSRLGLVRLEPPASEDDPNYGVHRPAGQEDPRQEWVFYLLTKETFDHGHWAVAPRDGGKVYNYGFN